MRENNAAWNRIVRYMWIESRTGRGGAGCRCAGERGEEKGGEEPGEDVGRAWCMGSMFEVGGSGTVEVSYDFIPSSSSHQYCSSPCS